MTTRGRSTWAAVLAGIAGGLVADLLLYATLYALVRYGAPDGGAGTGLGYLLLTLPVVGFALGVAAHRALRPAAWAAVLLAAVVTVVVLPHPVSVDCGNNISGFTCAGLRSS